MPVLIYGHDEALAKWCAMRIPHVGELGFGACKAVGVATAPLGEPGAKLLAVCVYHNWIPIYGVCEISFAASSPRWATRGVMRALLDIPFKQYKCRKVCLMIPMDNERALKFNEGIGFRRDGILRHHIADGRHAVVMSMMRSEYGEFLRRETRDIRKRWAPQDVDAPKMEEAA